MDTIGEGIGLAGRFAGLPNKFSNKESKVVIVPVPFDLTSTYQKGSDHGPNAVIEASRNMELYDIETATEPYTIGIFTAPAVTCKSSQQMLGNTYKVVKKHLEKDKFVITVGGEHSISQAPIRAHAEKYPGLSVLQLDAHADLQPAYEVDPLSHASVMSRVHEIPSIKNIIAVGIRSMSSEELPFQNKSHTYFAHDIYQSDQWMDKVVNNLADQVYLTLDLDVFDPAIMPSTGTPEPGGLDWNQVLRLLKKVAQKKQIVGFDIVELSPNPQNKAPDFLTAKLIYKLIAYIFNSTLKKVPHVSP